MKVALVYDRVNKWGGAERVLLVLHDLWPEAPLFTAVYHPEKAKWADIFQVKPSFLNRFPLAKSKHEMFPWLTPLAFESFNFDNFDLVISVTSADAKGVITSTKTLHVCYCLTPTRYLWSGYADYFRSSIRRFFTWPLTKYLQKWDLTAAQKPDHFIAISQTVARRIKEYYHRESKIIYPPVDLGLFKIASGKNKSQLAGQDFYLVVNRLVPYKKTDLVIRAFNQNGLTLYIIGTGSELKRLKKLAKSNIHFLGQLTDMELIEYYQNCRAVIFPQKEDFGLVPLEVQACGKPVIAFGDGGALETIIDGKTGLFFQEQTEKSLLEAIKKFNHLKINSQDCEANARRFELTRFKTEFKNMIEDLWKNRN
jgi:glycosyltransferase involved in cell wall biosynthesis